MPHYHPVQDRRALRIARCLVPRNQPFPFVKLRLAVSRGGCPGYGERQLASLADPAVGASFSRSAPSFALADSNLPAQAPAKLESAAAPGLASQAQAGVRFALFPHEVVLAAVDTGDSSALFLLGPRCIPENNDLFFRKRQGNVL